MNMKSILRWICVLPAAIVGMYIFYLFSLLLGYINFGWNVVINGNSYAIIGIIASVLANGFAGAGFVYLGVYTAPKFKVVTALTLMIISVLGSIYGICDDVHQGVFSWFETIKLLLTSFGSIVAFLNIEDNIEEMIDIPEIPIRDNYESDETYKLRVKNYREEIEKIRKRKWYSY